MSFTVVNEWWFTPEANVAEVKAAAAELVAYLKANEPGFQLSLWLEERNDPRHYFHITVFDDHAAFERMRESKGVMRFLEEASEHIVQDETFRAPECDVWLALNARFQDVGQCPV